MSCPKYKLSMKNKKYEEKYIYIKIHLILCFTSVLCFGLPINAQQNAKNGAADNNKKSMGNRYRRNRTSNDTFLMSLISILIIKAVTL